MLRLVLISSLVTCLPLTRVIAQATDRSRAAAVGTRDSIERDTGGIDALLALALAVHPSIRAASARADAARRRMQTAGLLSDPMLMAGVQNFPLGPEEGMRGPDPMTMRMIGVGQTIPYPGKRSLRRQVADRELNAARAAHAMAIRQVSRDVKDAYFEIVFLDRALEIVGRQHSVVLTLGRAAESRYVVGASGQQDILRARLEAARVAETAVVYGEQRSAAIARLNVLVDRPTDAATPLLTIPADIVRKAVPDSTRGVRFVSSALGARLADSPLPSLPELQDAALRLNPALTEQNAIVEAQAARAELSQKEFLPDVELSLQYGQRSGRPDMVTAVLSVPLPLQKRRRQDVLAAEALANLAALDADRAAVRNNVRAEVARLVSDLERLRAQLAIYSTAVIPHGRASLASSTASYGAGTVEFLTVVDNGTTLFAYEIEYFRALTEFARTLAELERVVGMDMREMLR